MQRPPSTLQSELNRAVIDYVLLLDAKDTICHDELKRVMKRHGFVNNMPSQTTKTLYGEVVLKLKNKILELHSQMLEERKKLEAEEEYESPARPSVSPNDAQHRLGMLRRKRRILLSYIHDFSHLTREIAQILQNREDVETDSITQPLVNAKLHTEEGYIALDSTITLLENETPIQRSDFLLPAEKS